MLLVPFDYADMRVMSLPPELDVFLGFWLVVNEDWYREPPAPVPLEPSPPVVLPLP